MHTFKSHWNKPCRYKTVSLHLSFVPCSQLLPDFDRLEKSHRRRWLMCVIDLARYRQMAHTKTYMHIQYEHMQTQDTGRITSPPIYELWKFVLDQTRPKSFPQYWMLNQFKNTLEAHWTVKPPGYHCEFGWTAHKLVGGIVSGTWSLLLQKLCSMFYRTSNMLLLVKELILKMQGNIYFFYFYKTSLCTDFVAGVSAFRTFFLFVFYCSAFPRSLLVPSNVWLKISPVRCCCLCMLWLCKKVCIVCEIQLDTDTSAWVHSSIDAATFCSMTVTSQQQQQQKNSQRQ